MPGLRFKGVWCTCIHVLSSGFSGEICICVLCARISLSFPPSRSACSTVSKESRFPDHYSPSVIGRSEPDVLWLAVTYHPIFRHSRTSLPRPAALLKRNWGMAFSCRLSVKGASEWSDGALRTTTHTGGKNFGKHPPLCHEAVMRGCRLPIRGTRFPVGEWTQGGLSWRFQAPVPGSSWTHELVSTPLPTTTAVRRWAILVACPYWRYEI